MRFLLPLLLCVACAPVDLSARPRNVTPACLHVLPQPNTTQKDDVTAAAALWNVRLDRTAFTVYPDCRPDAEYVPVKFVSGLAACAGDAAYGCVMRKSVNGRPYWNEVEISEDAPFYTIVHELGHLAGCSHKDMRPPCVVFSD